MIMKNLKFARNLIILLFLFAIIAKADVAPEANEMRVTADLTIETKEDLSDYRFFLDFAGDIRQIEIKNSGVTIIPPMGGGARYSSGTLIAVPAKVFDNLGVSTRGNENTITKATLEKVVTNKQLEGRIELLKFRFQQIIQVSERKSWTYPTYQIERDGNSLKAIKTKDLAPKISLEEEARIRMNSGNIIVVVVAVCVALAIFAVGIILLRKLLKRS